MLVCIPGGLVCNLIIFIKQGTSLDLFLGSDFTLCVKKTGPLHYCNKVLKEIMKRLIIQLER